MHFLFLAKLLGRIGIGLIFNSGILCSRVLTMWLLSFLYMLHVTLGRGAQILILPGGGLVIRAEFPFDKKRSSSLLGCWSSDAFCFDLYFS